MEASSRKRAREAPMDAALAAATPRGAPSPDGGAGAGLSLSALSTTGRGLGASSSTFAATSTLGATAAAGGGCSVAAHAQLAAAARQAELLRRLDADAAATVAADLRGQVDKLRAEVAGLTRSLGEAQSQLATSLAARAAGTAAGPQQAAAAQALSRELAAVKSERDAAAAEAAALARRLAAATDAARDADAAHAALVARYDGEMLHLQHELATARGDAAAAEARAVAAAAASSSRAGAGAGADKENSAADAAREAMALRESLRAEQRRARSLASELATWKAEAAGAALAGERLRAAEARAARLEATASHAAALSSLLAQACGLLGRYEAVARTRGGGNGTGAAPGGRTAAALPQLLAEDGGVGADGFGAAAASALAASSALADTLAGRIAAVQADAAGSRQRVAEAALKLDTVLRARDAAQADAAAARAAAAAATQAAADAATDKLRADTRAQLAAASVASLQNLLSTYDAEDRAFGGGGGGAGAATAAAAGAGGKPGRGALATAAYRARNAPPSSAGGAVSAPNPLAARVGALEKLLAQSQEANAALVGALDGAPLPGAQEALRARVAALEADLAAARAEADVLYRHFAPAMASGSAGAAAAADPSDAALGGGCCKCGGFSGVTTGVPFTLEDAISGGGGEGASISGSSASGAGAVSTASGRKVDTVKEEAEGGAVEDDAAAAAQAAAQRTALARVRVLHAVANPTSAALRAHDVAVRGALAAARADADAARAAAVAVADELRRLQLQVVTGGGGEAAASSSAAAASSLASSGLGGLNTTAIGGASSSSAAAADLEKLRKRLKDAFREGFQRYRSAVTDLMGFKVDLTGLGAAGVLGGPAGGTGGAGGAGGQVTVVLRSLYAESEGDYLEFKMTTPAPGSGPASAGPALEMLDTPWAQRLDKKLFSYLTVYRSIPAFLAAVTLDCFDRTTLSNTQMANVAAMLGGGDDDAAEAGGAGLARGGGGAGRPAAARQAWDSDGDANG